MTQVYTLPLGAYQTNCYVVHPEGETRCILIDPGYEAGTVCRFLEEKGLSLEAILLTHGHFDHVGAVRILAAETDCDVYLCAADLSMPPQFTAGPLYYTNTYSEGDVLFLAGLRIRVIQTPGHTKGSVCLLVEDAMFSGDTLFEGSCGRTDLPGGSWTEIVQSLQRLAAMEKDYKVYPGHGGSTTLAQEKRYNPYMR